MECVRDYEVLRGEQNEIIKEVSVAAENVIETFHFKSPYHMTDHGSHVNGLSWSDGQLEYGKLKDTIMEAVSGYAHLYAYGTAKTHISQTCWASLFAIWRILNVLSPTASRRNSVAVCRATRII